MRIACRQSSSQAIRPCWVVFLFMSSRLCSAQTDRAAKYTYMHSHTHTQPVTLTQHTSPQHSTRVSHSLASSYGRRFLFSPFSFLIISVCSSLPFFNILFLSLGYTCSRLLLQPPPSPLSLSPSLPPFPSLSRSLSLHLLSSLSSVCYRARGHYLSHSGHVRWNGGVCSEQKQRELWGIVTGSSSLGNSTVQQSSYQ